MSDSEADIHDTSEEDISGSDSKFDEDEPTADGSSDQSEPLYLPFSIPSLILSQHSSG